MGPVRLLLAAAALLQGAALLKWFIQEQANLIAQLWHRRSDEDVVLRGNIFWQGESCGKKTGSSGFRISDGSLYWRLGPPTASRVKGMFTIARRLVAPLDAILVGGGLAAAPRCQRIATRNVLQQILYCHLLSPRAEWVWSRRAPTRNPEAA
jgi:hypothetical protein